MQSGDVEKFIDCISQSRCEAPRCQDRVLARTELDQKFWTEPSAQSHTTHNAEYSKSDEEIEIGKYFSIVLDG